MDARLFEKGTEVRHRHAKPGHAHAGRVGTVVRQARGSVGVPFMVWVRWQEGRPPTRVPARHLEIVE